ncbi:MAG: Appr-1-p processing protein [Alphaproteobacteria bacterium]|nr:Appr-1-p processing protein [Alphaproteobacteria bacterium]
MIFDVTGDLLLSDAQLLAHGVAPADHFKHGLALALRERWPAMVKDFRHYCHLNHPKAGGVWTWGGPGGVRIANLMTQEPAADEGGVPGRATLPNVNHALRALRALIDEEGFTSVALPRLATGVGGLDWAEVRPLIEHHLGDAGIPVYVYATYHAGVKADEAGMDPIASTR